jgi:hypothetical protein
MSSTSDPAPSRLELFKLRQTILTDLTQALAIAAARAANAAIGQSTFTTDADLKQNQLLLRLFPLLLKQLPEKPPPPPPRPVITARRGDLPTNLPRPPCPICLERHWVSECPRQSEHDSPTLTKLMSKQSKWYAEAKQALEEQEIIHDD